MRYENIIVYYDENREIQAREILYLAVTPQHTAYFETPKGQKLNCNLNDIISIECDFRETMI